MEKLYDKQGNEVDKDGKIIKTVEELTKEQGGGTPSPNPPQDPAEPKPDDTSNPGNRPEDQNQKNQELEALNAKVERLTQQVTGSNEEALRLKGELEKAQGRIAELESTKPPVPVSDEEFNQRVAEVGQAQATRELVEKVVKPTQEKVDESLKEKAQQIYDSFKAKHPGLKDALLDRFNKEYGRLKSAYPTPEEALEAAYAVVGGEKADAEERERLRVEEERRKAEGQSQEEHQQVVSNASGGADDRKGEGGRPTAPNRNAELTKQIDSLIGQAREKEALGRNADKIWIEIEELKAKLAAQS